MVKVAVLFLLASLAAYALAAGVTQINNDLHVQGLVQSDSLITSSALVSGKLEVGEELECPKASLDELQTDALYTDKVVAGTAGVIVFEGEVIITNRDDGDEPSAPSEAAFVQTEAKTVARKSRGRNASRQS